MPQLDPTFYLSQVIWLVVSAIILYRFLSRYLIRNVEAILAERKNHIEKKLHQAQEKQKQAEAYQKKYKDLVTTTRQKTQAIINTQKQKIDALQQQRLQQSLATIQSDTQKAEDSIAKAAQQAQQDIEKDMHKLVVAIVAHVADMTISEKDALSALTDQQRQHH